MQARRWLGVAVAAISPLFPGLPGLGQIAQGRLGTGALLGGGLLAVNVAVLDTGMLNFRWGGKVWLGILVAVWLVALVDAIRDRRRRTRAGWEVSALAAVAFVAVTLWTSSKQGLLRLTPVTQVYTMSQPFMPPMLEPGDHVVVSGLAYRVSPPGRGDVVVIRTGDAVAPRLVLAIAGDELKIQSGHVFINGTDIAAPGNPPDFGPKNVPGDTLFVLGDPEGYSAIHTSDVIGRAEYVLWSPFAPSRTGRQIP